MSQRSDALWQVIKIAAPFIPAAGPYIAIADQVWPKVREIFVREGGDAADFDALMAETRRNIDLLANPGQFFGAPRVTPHGPIPATASPSMYGVLRTDVLLDDDALLELGYQIGDKVCIAAGAWMIIRKGQPTLGAQVLRPIGVADMG